MLMPKRVKYRRVQRGRLTGKAMSGNKVTNGSYGLVALEPAWITSNQIEAARIAMTRYIKRGGKVWIYRGEVLNVGANSSNRKFDRPERRQRKNGDNNHGGRRDNNRGPRREGNNNFRRNPRTEGGNKEC